MKMKSAKQWGVIQGWEKLKISACVRCVLSCNMDTLSAESENIEEFRNNAPENPVRALLGERGTKDNDSWGVDICSRVALQWIELCQHNTWQSDCNEMHLNQSKSLY